MSLFDDGSRNLWPYQVALPSALVQGTNGLAVLEFCENLEMCEVHDTIRRHGNEFWVYSFGNREDAEKFRARFNGTVVDRKPTEPL